MSGDRGEGRWFPTVLIHSLLIQGFTAAFRPALAYAMIAAGAPVWMLSALAASFAVPALVLALPAGRFVDVFGERRAAVLGALLVVAGVVAAILGADEPLLLLLLASLLVGAGHLPSIAAGQTQVAHRTSEQRLDVMYGYYSFSASCGQLLGPLLLTLPGGTRSLPPVMPVLGSCLGLALLLLVTAAMMMSSRHQAAPAVAGGALRQTGALVRRPGVLRALLVGAAAVAVLDIVQVYWPALGVERGYDVALVSAMLSLRAIASMASRLGLGLLVRRLGRVRLLRAAMLTAALALAATASALPVGAIAVAAVIFGFALGVCQPLSMSWLAALTPPHNRGLSVALRLGANRMGQTLVPVALGGVAAASGVWVVVLVSSGLLLVTTLLVRRDHGDHGPQEVID